MRRLGVGMGIVLLASLACGGGDPGFGSVELQTYRGGRTTYKFNVDGKFKMTWKNMSGDTVKGSYTQDGTEIRIEIDPDTPNTTSRILKLRQTGPCSVTRYFVEDKEGEEADYDPLVFERTQPKCDTVRVSQ